jgi:hypothetical protein
MKTHIELKQNNNVLGFINNKSYDTNTNTIIYKCDVYSCDILYEHINKIVKNPPVKLINKIIKRLELFDESLKMTIFGLV